MPLPPIRSPSWNPPKTPLTDKKIREYILQGVYGEEKKQALIKALANRKPAKRRVLPKKTNPLLDGLL